MLPLRFLSALLASLLIHQLGLHAQETLDLAPGLSIRKVADDNLVPDCSSLAVDWNGAIAVSGPGYIRRLVDQDRDGEFESTEEIFSTLRHGAHGLLFHRPYLYFVANDGVWRLNLETQNIAETSDSGGLKPERVLAIKTGGEHHAHALRMGPDGFWYLIVGNGVDNSKIPNVASPVENPRAGVIFRISSDWQQRQVWAHGFRNAYDFDFAADGSIITFDSDGEREVSLPWYRPTRVYQVQAGDDAGWVTRNWKVPNYDPAMPTVLAEFGRGSPTGVLNYRSDRLPARFYQANIVLDWTFGRILAVRANGETEVMVQPAGTSGFAVTDIDVLPNGALAVSVGGRRSRGGVYIVDREEEYKVASARTQPEPAESELLPDSQLYQSLNAQAKKRYQYLNSVGQGQRLDGAIEVLEAMDSDSASQVAAMRVLLDLFGGCGATLKSDGRDARQKAAVFDAYRTLRPVEAGDLASRWEAALLNILERPNAVYAVREEAVRGLAVIASCSELAKTILLKELRRTSDPSRKLHRLLALARVNPAFTRDEALLMADVMLEIPAEIKRLGRNVDRNWTPRLEECFRALNTKATGLGGMLIEAPEFGDPSHLVWCGALDEKSRAMAAGKLLRQSASRRDASVARFIDRSGVEVPSDILLQWARDPELKPIAWKRMCSQPKTAYVKPLSEAVQWIDPGLSKKASAVIFELTGERIKRTQKSPDQDYWMNNLDAINELEGEKLRGKLIFAARQCARCHNAAKALGPSLEGISKRFGSADLLKSTVEPSDAISDRYRAIQILTEDGEVVVGFKVYESVDGLTLLDAQAQTRRVNSEDIRQQRTASESLMPTGLLQGASLQDVADLLAYLNSL
ncbi:MAG: hypothetical protein AAF483_17670 [Planctomycetota bacterium]